MNQVGEARSGVHVKREIYLKLEVNHWNVYKVIILENFSQLAQKIWRGGGGSWSVWGEASPCLLSRLNLAKSQSTTN